MANKVTLDQIPDRVSRNLSAFAEICHDVYAPAETHDKAWHRLDEDDVRALGIRPEHLRDASQHLLDGHSDLKAGIYKTNDDQLVVAFAGSQSAKDWYQNLKQGIGLETGQYTKAAELARKAAIADKDVVFTGHSLGGGLATMASAVTDRPAINFNPAGLHRNSVERLGIDYDTLRQKAETGMVHNITAKGDILQIVNGLPGTPNPIGQTLKLDGQSLDGKGPVQRHLMGAVIDVLEETQTDRHAETSTSEFLQQAETRWDAMKDGPQKDQARDALDQLKARAEPTTRRNTERDDFDRDL